MINTIKNKLIEKTANIGVKATMRGLALLKRVEAPAFFTMAKVTGSEVLENLAVTSICNATDFEKVAQAEDPVNTLAEFVVAWATEIYPQRFIAAGAALESDMKKVENFFGRIEKAIEAFNEEESMEDSGGVLHDHGFIPDVNAVGMTPTDEWLDNG